MGSIAPRHFFEKKRPVSRHFAHIAGSLRQMSAFAGFCFTSQFRFATEPDMQNEIGGAPGQDLN